MSFLPSAGSARMVSTVVAVALLFSACSALTSDSDGQSTGGDVETDLWSGAVWLIEDPRNGDWPRVDVPTTQPDGNEAMPAAGRLGTTDIIVGYRGRFEEERPAVWGGDGSGDWTPVEADQFETDRSERLEIVSTSGAEAIALGSRREADGSSTPRSSPDWRRPTPD